jgi:hypothetical protein
MAATLNAAAGPWRFLAGVIGNVAGILGDIIRLAGQAVSALARIKLPGPVSGALGALGAIFGASGGIFDKATLLIAGEAGKEVLLPLTNPARALDLAQQSGLFDTLAAAVRTPAFIPSRSTSTAPGGDNITMNLFFASGTTPDQANALSRAAIQGVEQEKRRQRARLEARIA